MSLKEQVVKIEFLEANGFVFILKWDGERHELKRTVIVTLPGTDHFFRQDTDSVEETIDEAFEWAKEIASL